MKRIEEIGAIVWWCDLKSRQFVAKNGLAGKLPNTRPDYRNIMIESHVIESDYRDNRIIHQVSGCQGDRRSEKVIDDQVIDDQSR